MILNRIESLQDVFTRSRCMHRQSNPDFEPTDQAFVYRLAKSDYCLSIDRYRALASYHYDSGFVLWLFNAASFTLLC